MLSGSLLYGQSNEISLLESITAKISGRWGMGCTGWRWDTRKLQADQTNTLNFISLSPPLCRGVLPSIILVDGLYLARNLWAWGQLPLWVQVLLFLPPPWCEQCLARGGGGQGERPFPFMDGADTLKKTVTFGFSFILIHNGELLRERAWSPWCESCLPGGLPWDAGAEKLGCLSAKWSSYGDAGDMAGQKTGWKPRMM